MDKPTSRQILTAIAECERLSKIAASLHSPAMEAAINAARGK